MENGVGGGQRNCTKLYKVELKVRLEIGKDHLTKLGVYVHMVKRNEDLGGDDVGGWLSSMLVSQSHLEYCSVVLQLYRSGILRPRVTCGYNTDREEGHASVTMHGRKASSRDAPARARRGESTV